MAILRSSKKALLKSAGFPADYLEPVYECPDCKDTGYINGRKCHCFKKAVSRLLYSQSNLCGILSLENFDTFSSDYYSPNFIDPKSGRSARDIIEDAFLTCKDFVRTFGKEHKNLFFYRSEERRVGKECGS